MPIKLIILGVFVVGVTIGTVVSSSNGANKGAGGCDVLGSSSGSEDSTSDAAGTTEDVSADGGSNGSDQSSGDTSGSSDGGDASGVDTGTTDGGDSGDGSTGDGSTSDGGTGSGSGDGSSGSGDGAGDGTDGGNNDDGNGNNGGDDTPGTPAITGQYSGTVTVTDTQSLSETPGPPRTSTMTEAITFTDAPLPEGVTILNYTNNPNLRTTALQVGDQQTLTQTASGMNITLGVRVTEATYTSTTARIQYALTFNAQGGNLVQAGTGTQLVTASLDASGNLSYVVDTEYRVRLTAGSIVFNTLNTKDATGTLTRQDDAGEDSGSGDNSQ